MIRTTHICDRCQKAVTNEQPAGHTRPLDRHVDRFCYLLGEAEIEADLCRDCDMAVRAMISKLANDIRASLVPLHQPAAAT